jgi:hypothetical protein
MAWGAFFGSVVTMEKSRAAGAHADREADRHPAVLRLLGPFRPDRLPSVLAAAGGRNDVQEIPVNKRTGVRPDYGITREIELQATNKKGESPMVFALTMHHPQWKAALQPVGFVPSDRLIATTLACASEEPKTDETAFLGRILTPAMLSRPYRV